MIRQPWSPTYPPQKSRGRPGGPAPKPRASGGLSPNLQESDPTFFDAGLSQRVRFSPTSSPIQKRSSK